jgi:hypothetical protein
LGLTASGVALKLTELPESKFAMQLAAPLAVQLIPPGLLCTVPKPFGYTSDAIGQTILVKLARQVFAASPSMVKGLLLLVLQFDHALN